MFNLFGKKKETVSKAEHEALLDDLRATHARLQRELQIERDTVARKVATIRCLKAELDTACESNLLFLEQRDAARAEAEANKVDAEELAAWRKYGQMRAPVTGRLVPRVKAEVTDA